jgi:hypothetical protein
MNLITPKAVAKHELFCSTNRPQIIKHEQTPSELKNSILVVFIVFQFRTIMA